MTPSVPLSTRASRGRYTVIVGGVLTATVLLVTTLRSVAADPPAAAASGVKPALTVNAVQATRQVWPVELSANGNITAWQEALVGAEAAGLRITDVRVNVGDTVRKGQLLVSLEAASIEAELAATQAALAEAEAAQTEAQANGERARLLQSSGAISAQQIQQYLTAERTAQARAQAQRARLKAERVRLAQTRIVAPDAGVVSARAATVGAVVQPGQDLLRLIRGGRLEWRAEIAAADLARVKAGQGVEVVMPDGTPVAGTVRIVAPTIDPATRNGLVYVDLKPGSAARAGMFARGRLRVGQTDALTLPQSAVSLRDGYSYVFRIGPDQRVTQTKVGVGRRVGARVEILTGLKASESVVASGVGFLADGDAVRVVAPARQP